MSNVHRYKNSIFPMNIIATDFDGLKELKDDWGVTNEDGTEITAEQIMGEACCVSAKRVDEYGHTYYYSVLVFRLQSLNVGEIAHEAFHCVQDWMERLGVPFMDKYPNETYAYCLGWLVNEIYNDFLSE